MKNLNISLRLLVLVTFITVIVGVGSSIGAGTPQNQPARGSRIGPQAREAADEVGVVVQGGITHGQTLRFDVFRAGTINPGPPSLNLTVFDSQGGILTQATLSVQILVGTGVAHFDLNADTLPQEKFDNAGRLEFTGVLSTVNPGPPGCDAVASGEVFDNITGKTLAHIPGAAGMCIPGPH